MESKLDEMQAKARNGKLRFREVQALLGESTREGRSHYGKKWYEWDLTQKGITAQCSVNVFGEVESFIVTQPAPLMQPAPRYSIAAYNAKVDEVIADVQAAGYPAALAKLEAAGRMRNDIETGRLLAQFVGLLQAAGEDLDKLNWSEARRYLESILDARNASDKTIALAKDRLAWLDKEQVAIGLREEDLRRLKGADGNDETLLEVRQALLQLPAGTFAARKAKADIAAIDKLIAEIERRRAAKK